MTEQLGRYQLADEVGTTDVATVYRAFEVTAGGLVRSLTVKRLRPELAGQLDKRSLLVEEGRIAGQLEHDNVLRIHDLGPCPGSWLASGAADHRSVRTG